MTTKRLVAALGAALCVSLGGAGVSAGGTSPETTEPTEPAAPATPTPEWEQIVPGGDCECADGSEFSFWNRASDPTKVVFFLEGGGACFSAESCAFTNAASYEFFVDDIPGNVAGIFDYEQAANPLAGYSAVYVPYCTGDSHLGDATQEYAPGLTVEHNGSVNTGTAMAYLVENYPDVEEIVVVGESAGSVATPVYAGLLAEQVPDAQITVLADGSGVYNDSPELAGGIGAGLWNAQIPDFAMTDPATGTWDFLSLYDATGLSFPEIRWARHDYAFDAVQARFATNLGLDASDLLALIDANDAFIEAGGVEIDSYIAPGADHTAVQYDSFYTETVGGVPLVDWVTALINGEDIEDVHCEDCAPPQ